MMVITNKKILTLLDLKIEIDKISKSHDISKINLYFTKYDKHGIDHLYPATKISINEDYGEPVLEIANIEDREKTWDELMNNSCRIVSTITKEKDYIQIYQEELNLHGHGYNDTIKGRGIVYEELIDNKNPKGQNERFEKAAEEKNKNLNWEGRYKVKIETKKEILSNKIKILGNNYKGGE